MNDRNGPDLPVPFLFPIAAVVLLLSGQARAEDPPIPAPGQNVPPHAAGGWPTSLSGDGMKPGRTAEQQARLDSVAKELSRIVRTHGPDSVVLQSKLMVRSMAAGALGPTEVQVGHGAEVQDPEHLRIRVDTGLYFDESLTTIESRFDEIWRQIALPVLSEMSSFHIEPSALELVLYFDVQDTRGKAESRLDPSEPARHEGFRVRLSRPLLEDMAAHRVEAAALRDKVEFVPAVAVATPD